ncbi:MAG: glycosyltransferase family 4 protein [Dehalococcoidia bacterium]|nr:glycosyltransferase family 4 protein [Dehalococcoidia bacterium]
MRILVCVSEYPPHGSGIADVAGRMVKEFGKRGHRCIVCSPTGPDIRLGGQRLINRMAGIGLLLYWWRVRRHFAGKTPEWDAVWLHWPLFPGRCPFPSAVITFHGTYRGFRGMARDMRSPWLVRLYYALMQSAEERCLRSLPIGDHVFSAVSPRSVAELNAQGVGLERVTYVPVGVDTNQFQAAGTRARVRAELGIPPEALVLLYVGRLTRPKNLMALVDAFVELKKEVPGAVLVIVGSGELEGPLARHIDERKTPDVRLLGFIPNHELPQVYGCADFFIMSSTYEGQPVVLLEAMACGLPPILSDIPAMRDVVGDSGLGLLVGFDDPIGAAHQIAEYVSSPKAWQDRVAVRDYVVKNMSSSACAEKYLELLTQVARKAAQGTSSKREALNPKS